MLPLFPNAVQQHILSKWDFMPGACSKSLLHPFSQPESPVASPGASEGGLKAAPQAAPNMRTHTHKHNTPMTKERSIPYLQLPKAYRVALAANGVAAPKLQPEQSQNKLKQPPHPMPKGTGNRRIRHQAWTQTMRSKREN